MTLRARIVRLVLAGTLAVTSMGACAQLPFRTEGERLPGVPRGPQRKTVSTKEPPSRLVAIDGTVCLVSASRYAEVDPGDRVWCDWQPRRPHPAT
jgi:hypothetical protein